MPQVAWVSASGKVKAKVEVKVVQEGVQVTTAVQSGSKSLLLVEA